jgi:hypothetical protein
MIEVKAKRDVNIAGSLSSAGNTGGRISVNGRNINALGKMSANARIATTDDGTGSAGGTGSNATGPGGSISLAAKDNVVLTGDTDLSGAQGGGSFSLSGQNLFLSSPVNTSSTNGAGGNITLAALNSAILTDQSKLTASGSQNGGAIKVDANNLSIANGSALDAGASAENQAAANTGSISLTAPGIAEIGGNLTTSGQSGGGPVTVNAGTLNTSGSIDASGIGTGAGGNVTLNGMSGNVFSGNILSKGGATSGNGGLVNISAPNTGAGTADVTSSTGTAGTVTR